MSRRPPQQVEERIRELARRNPGWSPSQLAIYLQGEKLKVTSEDVRRVLARPGPTAEDDPAVATPPPRYTAPREERTRSALPIGLVFGVLLTLFYLGIQAIRPALGAGVTQLMVLLGSVLLLLATGGVASRRFASPVRAGSLAGIVYLSTLAGLAVALYAQIQQITGQTLPFLSDSSAWGGLAFAIVTLLIIFGVFGALLGWLGGRLFGRKRRRRAFE